MYEATLQGQMDYIHKAKNENPYPAGSMQHRQYEEGYNSMAEAAENIDDDGEVTAV